MATLTDGDGVVLMQMEDDTQPVMGYGEGKGFSEYPLASMAPAPTDVRLGVTYMEGEETGTLALPAESDVRAGTQYGAAGTEFTGGLDAVSYVTPLEVAVLAGYEVIEL